MDGYSVKDAAIILGVPERRVWELLARGVLAGAPEGPDGMIVFLQPRSSPASAAPSSGPTSASGETAGAKANGNGGSGELSPFRELLTEFRNLTERYGQALLALGEARGEVASLRTRVEVLEARMDLRLPSSPPTATVAWELPEFAAEEAAASVPEAEAFSAEEPMAFETVAPLTDELDAFEADEPLADQVVAEVDESVAGEDEPAAEPMIDLIEEAIFAEPLLEGDEEPILETPVDEIETSLPELAEPEAGEQAAEAAAIEPSGGGEVLPEPPRRRARGGRTAIAGFAAALARADDPTLAELPGAEETAAALAALQRDIDASRAGEPVAEPQLEPEPEAIAEPQLEPEPEAIAEPAEFEEIAAAAAVEEAQPEAIDEPEPVGTEVEPVEAAAPAAAATEPAQSSVPSYYSTDVVEPDWFADGDFSWLEAAQAEAMRVEATQAEAAGAPAEPAVEAAVALDQEPEPVAIPEQSADVVAEPEPAQAADAGEMSHAATDVAEEVAGNETEVAFGEHTSTEAAPPDLGHEGFEPSAESQAMAEEEARAAIHEAFDEAPASDERESPEAGPAVAVAEAVAEPEPEIEPEAEWVAEAVAEPEPVPEMVPEPETIREPEAVAEQEVVQEPEAVPEPEAVAEPEAAMAGETAAAEVRADEILADGEDVSESIVEDSPEAEAIQDAFEPEQPPVEDIHAQHEAEVEAEAIQEAFEEPMPAPEWSAAAAPAAADEALAREDQFRDAAGQPSYEPTDQPPPTDEAPRVIDDAPRARGAEATVSAVRGPEEFIAPPPSAPPPVTQPGSVSGEEELMWLGDEFEEADLEVAAQGWRSPDAPSSGAAKASPTLELSDAELTQLAEDEGWDSDEVEAIRRLLGRPSDAPSEAAGPDAPAGSDAPAGRREEPAQGSPSTSPIPEPWSPDPSDPAHDPEWLEGRSGAAAEAYRRLRKLFPS